jgi:hypothetical protein
VVLPGKQHVGDGRLRFTAHKNRNRARRMIDILVLPELQAVIDASPTGDVTFLLTEFGKPYHGCGFRQLVRATMPRSRLGFLLSSRTSEGGCDDRSREWHKHRHPHGHLRMGYGEEAERYTKVDRTRLATDGTPLLVRAKREQKSLTLYPQMPGAREKRAKG